MYCSYIITDTVDDFVEYCCKVNNAFEMLREMKSKYKIGFINQSTGRLFNELVEDLSLRWHPSILYTGFVMGKFSNTINGKLEVELLNPPIRKSNISRLTSGLRYFFNLRRTSSSVKVSL